MRILKVKKYYEINNEQKSLEILFCNTAMHQKNIKIQNRYLLYYSFFLLTLIIKKKYFNLYNIYINNQRALIHIKNTLQKYKNYNNFNNN